MRNETHVAKKGVFMSGDQQGEHLRPAEIIRAGAITRRYYVDGASKLDIAREFGLSRFKVARVLEDARRSGLVRFDIVLPKEIDPDLSDSLRARYSLRQAIVVETSGDLLRRDLGAVAADYLAEVVEEGDVLGLASSRTLNEMTLALTGVACSVVVQLTGALSSVHVEENSIELVRRVASIAGGTAFPIYAPMLVSDPAAAAALRQQPEVAEAIARHSDITTAVVAVGSWEPLDSLIGNAIPAAEREALRDRGVRAEVCGRLIDATGRPVTDLDDRVIAITESQLRSIPEVVAVAGGRHKADAIRAVLQGGLATSLVTDAEVARALLA
jgi:DNA-binding transcriptional regulator LsrR (DeoR family)